MTSISNNHQWFICPNEGLGINLACLETVFKMSVFCFSVSVFWLHPSLQCLVTISLSAEDFNCCYLSMLRSMKEQSRRALVVLWVDGFVSEQADLIVVMLDCSNKFLLFLPVALKAERRRKLTQGKVLTGRLVYDLIFNLFFTYIWEECHNY